MQPMIGALFLTLLVILTLTLNIKNVISAISSITPFLLVLIFIITVYSIFTSDASASELAAEAANQPSAAPNWLVGGMLYVSYNIAAGVSMLAIIGGTVKDEKIASRGGFLGGLGLGLLLFLINLGLFVNMNKIQGADMPTLFLANDLSPLFGALMVFFLSGMIFFYEYVMLFSSKAGTVSNFISLYT